MRGSTRVRTSEAGMTRISWVCGKQKIVLVQLAQDSWLTSSVSENVCNVTARYHLLLYAKVTNPLIFSNAKLSWLAVFKLTTLASAQVEYTFTSSWFKLIGLKACRPLVPTMVFAELNLASKSVPSELYSSLVVKVYSSYVSVQYSNNCLGVIIWSLYGLCKLAQAADLLTVPPTPSHGPLPWEVAKKCHSARIPLKSDAWWHRLAKFLQFLYWDDAPSEK